MRVLLDECVPVRLARHLSGHAVSTVGREGFSGLKNGRLLRAAEEKWEVLLTTDKAIPSQQSVGRYRMGLLIVRAFSNDWPTLASFIPEMLRVLPFIQPGTVTRIGDPKLLDEES